MLGDTEIKQIQDAIQNGIANREIAGANLLLMKDGKEVFYQEAGFSDLEKGKALTRDSMFRLYSMTKPVTAAAVMILVERGIIDLYEPAGTYLPGFRNQMVWEKERLVPVLREVTILDLLSMTSGLVYGGYGRAGKETEELFQEIGERLLGESPMSTMEIVNKLGTCALAYQPGEFWQYGTSADVLGAVIEAASGISFGDFMRKELFEPLGMKDTDFWVPEEKRERLVQVYADNGKKELIPYTGNHLGIQNRMDRKPAFESGGAGLVSTIDDYARFAAMLMNGGTYQDIQILRPRTVKYLTTGSLSTRQQSGFEQWHTLSGHSYGCLMRIMKDTSKAGNLGCMGEYGWDGWLGPYFCNCPGEQLTFLLMMQKTDSGTTPLTRKLRNIIFSACCKN